MRTVYDVQREKKKLKFQLDYLYKELDEAKRSLEYRFNNPSPIIEYPKKRSIGEIDMDINIASISYLRLCNEEDVIKQMERFKKF